MQITKLKTIAIAAGFAISMSLPAIALEDAPESFADLVDTISPSVVSISTEISVPGRGGAQLDLPPNMPDFFRDLLENNPNFQQQGPREGRSLGSGFIIDEEGYIVTNNHVIENATSIMVETIDHQSLKAEVVGKDPKTDVALLKVEPEQDLISTKFGDSDQTRVGDWVIAIGNPLGRAFSVSAGIVSARNRSLEGAYDDYIQTDAAINRGNSGGPLFNMDGEVIGMNTAILSPDGGSIGIGFAMSSRVVSQVVDQLKEFGTTRRGWLGVQIQPMTEEFANAMGMDKVQGVLVSGVPEGPAKDAGIEEGDVILKFDGQKIDDVSQLVRIVGQSEVGKTLDVEIYRFNDDETITKKVKLGRLEDEDQIAENTEEDAPSTPSDDGQSLLGMTLEPLTPEMAQQFGIEEPGGLLVTAIEPDGIADSRALQAGDVVRSANREDVNSVKELEDVIEAAKKDKRDSILLVVDRNGTGNFIALPLE